MKLPEHPVFIANFSVNMNKSIDGLCLIISGVLGKNPTEPGLYVFLNHARNRVKILYWERNGFCLWYKRLEKEKFKFPPQEGEIIRLEPRQLAWLLAGLDFTKLQGHQRLNYSIFG
jgi:transposase